MKQVWG